LLAAAIFIVSYAVIALGRLPGRGSTGRARRSSARA